MASEENEEVKKQKPDFRGQHDGEDVQMLFRKHPISARRGLIYSMLALLAGTIPSLINPVMSLLWLGLLGGLILGALIMSPYWISWYYSIFMVTNERFIQVTQKGLFTRSVSDMALKHIQSLNFQIAGSRADNAWFLVQ